MVPNSFRTGPCTLYLVPRLCPSTAGSSPKLDNTSLLHSPPPVELFKLFITDDFVTKMAEQTSFYAVQSQYLMGS